jgi:hypothetical protein
LNAVPIRVIRVIRGYFSSHYVNANTPFGTIRPKLLSMS